MLKNNKNIWALLGLLLLSANASHAVVVEDTSSSTSVTNGQTLSWTHTTGSAAERLLIVTVSQVGRDNSVSSVTYGGTDLTQWATESSAFPVHADIWYLVAPATGDATVEVTLAESGWAVAGGTTWSGVDQTDPLGPASVANGTGATASVNVTSTADNIVVDVLAWAGTAATGTAGATQTEYWNDGVLVRNGGSVYGGSSSEPGSADVEMSWDMSNQFTYALVAADIQSASSTPDVTPPTVDITAPAEGAIVSGNIAVDADASDDIGVVGVQFQLDGVDLDAEDTTAPYSVNWDTTTSADGSYELTAIARDGADNQTTSTIINVTVENTVVDVTPPTVDITSPADLDTVAATVTINADASDDIGVVGVQFQLDGVDLGAEDTTAPYSVDWDTTLEADGDYALTAVARDAADNQTTSVTITVTVDNSVPDVTPPTIDITSPADLDTVSGTVTVDADATDDIGVVGVQFQLDGVDLGAEDLTAPYSVDWDTTLEIDGDFALTAVARDAADNQTTSATITVSVENTVPDVTAPTVDITSPADLDTVSGTVTIDADASDDVGVVGVQFQLDGVDLGAEDTTAPYSVSWDTNLEADGDYAITAIARDAADNQTTSTTINVTVDNSVSGGGGISHDASSSSTVANGSTYSWTHTTGSGADRLLIVGVSVVNGSNAVSNVTYGGASLTQWATESSAFPVTAEMWYMVAPPAGAATVEVTLSSSEFSAAGAASFEGVNQVAPLGTAVAANGTGATASVNVASSADNFVFDVLAWAAFDGSATAGASQTEHWSDGVLVRNGGYVYASSSSEPGAADVEMSWTITSQISYAVLAAEIVAATGGGDVTPPTSDITSPANLDIVSGTINVDADATDSTGVVGVQFQLDGVDLGAEDLTSPYSVSWDTTTVADGDYSLTAIARDAADNQTTSATITVTVDNSAAGSPPTVTITDPTDGTTVTDGTSITFVGTADDVEDGVLDGSINWSSDLDGDLGTASSISATLSVGTHTITASVTDSDSDTGTDTITVTVNAVGGGDGPNILLIVSDDMGADTSELFPELAGDNGQAPTPRLSQLAAEGIVFDNAWASPQCSPTRATIASGLYGHNTGVLTAGDNLGGTTTSIWEYLATDSPDNYAMAVFGKWHIGDVIGHVTNDTGVPTYSGFLDGFIDDFYDWSYIDETGATTNTTTYSTTAITDFAIDFVTDHENSANADDPWFVYVPYAAPHGTSANDGFQVPPAGLFTVDVGGRPAGDPTIYNGEISVYQAMIEAMDTEIGRMLDELELLGELDNTIVIFLGDNGTPAPIQDSNVGNRGTKSTVFEGGVHVPMIISGAGVTRVDAREEHVVTSTDIYATIAELSGIPVSEINNSFSLVPLFTDGNATSGRQFSFSEVCGGSYAIRDDRYKVLYDADTGGFQMYDLQTDPEEQTDLYGDASVAAEQAVLEAELEILEQNATSGGCFQ